MKSSLGNRPFYSRYSLPVALLFATASMSAIGGCCACPKKPASADGESGFVSIFNGVDTSGWVYGTHDGKPHRSGAGYGVRDGVLFCTAKDGGNLFTEREYGDFAFRFEFRLTENANNGIGVRAPLEGDAAYVGLEIQVLDDSGSEYRSLKPWQYHGSVYGVVAARRGAQRPVGEWNEEEISIVGSKIRVTLNGQVIVDSDLASVRDPEILKAHPGLERRRGHIGFLGHGTRVEFRNMRLREL